MSFYNQLITTGQFAKAAGTTKDTLLHYERIGLFLPVHVAANGYRYYSPRQFGVFSDIQNLKKTGMQLAEIKNYMDKRSPLYFIELLERQIDQTKKQLERLSDSLCDMQTALFNAREARDAGDEIRLVCCPAVLGIASYDPSHAFGKNFSDFWTILQKNNTFTYNILCGILNIRDIQNGDYQKYSGIYAQINGSASKGAEIVRPAGQYLIGYHHGPAQTVGKTYRRLLDYAKTHRLPLAFHAFEEYLLYEVAAQREDQFVTKLLLQLR